MYVVPSGGVIENLIPPETAATSTLSVFVISVFSPSFFYFSAWIVHNAVFLDSKVKNS